MGKVNAPLARNADRVWRKMKNETSTAAMGNTFTDRLHGVCFIPEALVVGFASKKGRGTHGKAARLGGQNT